MEDNCFTILCWFLLYNNWNQSQLYIYIYIPSLVSLSPHSHPASLMWSQSARLGSLCSSFPQLPILHVMVYICHRCFLNSSYSPFILTGTFIVYLVGDIYDWCSWLLNYVIFQDKVFCKIQWFCCSHVYLLVYFPGGHMRKEPPPQPVLFLQVQSERESEIINLHCVIHIDEVTVSLKTFKLSLQVSKRRQLCKF